METKKQIQERINLYSKSNEELKSKNYSLKNRLDELEATVKSLEGRERDFNNSMRNADEKISFLMDLIENNTKIKLRKEGMNKNHRLLPRYP